MYKMFRATSVALSFALVFTMTCACEVRLAPFHALGFALPDSYICSHESALQPLASFVLNAICKRVRFGRPGVPSGMQGDT